MTLSQLNRIAVAQKVEPDLPGVHSSGMVANMPPDLKKKLFQEMRDAIGAMADNEFEQLNAQCVAAQRTVDDCEQALARAQAECDRLNQLRVDELKRRKVKGND